MPYSLIVRAVADSAMHAGTDPYSRQILLLQARCPSPLSSTKNLGGFVASYAPPAFLTTGVIPKSRVPPWYMTGMSSEATVPLLTNGATYGDISKAALIRSSLQELHPPARPAIV